MITKAVKREVDTVSWTSPKARFPAKRTQRNRWRCVNENRKQRKHLIGCFEDRLFRSTISIGWRLCALRLDGNRVLRNVFDCVIFLRFLRTFLTQSVACVAFSWKPGLSLSAKNIPAVLKFNWRPLGGDHWLTQVRDKW